jgi:hypothetical protein
MGAKFCSNHFFNLSAAPFHRWSRYQSRAHIWFDQRRNTYIYRHGENAVSEPHAQGMRYNARNASVSATDKGAIVGPTDIHLVSSLFLIEDATRSDSQSLTSNEPARFRCV